MKFPNNIILDLPKNSISFSNKYWVFNYFHNFKTNLFDFDTFTFHKSFIFKKENLLLNHITKNKEKFTFKYKQSNERDLKLFFKKNPQNYNQIFKLRPKIKHKKSFTNYWNNRIKNNLNNSSIVDETYIKKILLNFSVNKINFQPNSLLVLFDINFLKKEKIYTKLKYSRVPQYDIVSGGLAALFAGFLGFLICEKFGFELLDSGDFYFLFMYLVFFFFFCRLYVKLLSNKISSWNLFSLKWVFYFYKVCLFFLINFIKKLINNK